MVPYFQRMKLVSSSWLRPRTILDQPTTVTLGTPRVNNVNFSKKMFITDQKNFGIIVNLRNLVHTDHSQFKTFQKVWKISKYI